MLNGEKRNAFPLRSGTKEGYPPLPPLSNIVLEILAVDIPSSWIGTLDIDIVKMSIVPKSIYRFYAIPSKIPMGIFVSTHKLSLKFMCTHKRTSTARIILKRGIKLEKSHYCFLDLI